MVLWERFGLWSLEIGGCFREMASDGLNISDSLGFPRLRSLAGSRSLLCCPHFLCRCRGCSPRLRLAV